MSDESFGEAEKLNNETIASFTVKIQQSRIMIGCAILGKHKIKLKKKKKKKKQY